MASVTYSNSANIEYIAALKIIHHYFTEKELPELGNEHINLFEAELKSAEKRLAVNPELYPLRDDYPSLHYGKKYRSFTVHWFVVFYTYTEADGVIVWHIRPSRSDYSNIIWLP